MWVLDEMHLISLPGESGVHVLALELLASELLPVYRGHKNVSRCRVAVWSKG